MKTLLFSAIFTVCGFIVSAQPTFVDTTPSNKNAVIEQFTYKNVNNDETDNVINTLIANNPNRVFGINIRETSLRTGISDFTCKAGAAFISYFNPDFSPDANYNIIPGMVNRGTMEKMNRWNSSTNAILSQPSCLNVAAKVSIDWNLRQLTLTVEVYYTGNSNTSENYLTVALLQNNLEETENIYQAYMLPNGNYNHLRMLRAIISEQWGDTIVQTTQGSFFTKTYTYTIPDTVESALLAYPLAWTFRPKVLLEDLEVLVFVSESKTNIISGNKAELSHVNIPDLNLRVQLDKIRKIENAGCGDDFPVYLTIKNIGNDTIYSIEYTVLKDNQIIFQNQDWSSRLICPFAADTITIDNIPMQGGVESLISIEVTKINEKDTLITEEYTLVRHLVENVRGAITLVIAPDQWASRTIFYFYDADGNRTLTNLYNTWSNLSSPGIREYTYDIYPEKVGCYSFYISENLNKGYGKGYFKLLAEDGTELMYNDGKNCGGLWYFFNVTEPYTVGVQNFQNVKRTVFPNPARSQFTVTNTKNASLQLYNMVGQEILHTQSTEENTIINVSTLPQGLYMLKVVKDGAVKIYKVVISR